MNCADKKTHADKKLPSIMLVGNPNVGKSVIFGLLTGKYVDVSNYPGTTVEVSRGKISIEGRERLLIDSPGINSLHPRSEDERVTRDILISSSHEGIIQVVDSKNLNRGLAITLQLIELDVPMILVLNLSDEAVERGVEIDSQKLSSLIGIDVIKTVAVERRGLPELKNSLKKIRKPSYKQQYNEKILSAVNGLSHLIIGSDTLAKKGLALMMLAEEIGHAQPETLKLTRPEDKKKAREIIEETAKKFRNPLDFELHRLRQTAVDNLCSRTVKKDKKTVGGIKAALGNLSMHPIWGVPILSAILFTMYKFVGEFGAGTMVDFFESVIFGEYINPVFINAFDKFLPIPFLREMFVGEYGIITMGITYSISIVLPIVSFFFIFFGILEDSGYLARLTLLSDKILKKMGMNGKAVLPMVLGLGCGTMATLTVRILETRKERIIATLLLALGVPCSAQLGVIMGMLGSLSMTALITVVITVLLQFLIVGYLAAKLLPGERSDFLIEIPPFRVPKLSNILTKTYFRVKWFVKEAVPLFILGTFMLFIFEKLGLLALIERLVSPIITGVLGLPAKATGAFIVGFLRRDYGAAGLFQLVRNGQMDINQITVGVSVMVLFVPCLAHFFIIIKEQGMKRAALMAAFIFSYAVMIGGVLQKILTHFPILE